MLNVPYLLLSAYLLMATTGNEPSGLTLTKLAEVRSVIWTEQRRELAFVL